MAKYHYAAYGLHVCSEWPLVLPKADPRGSADVLVGELSENTELDAIIQGGTCISETPYRKHVRLADGGDYMQWFGQFEFIVSSNGRDLRARRIGPGGSDHSFQAYLLAQAISFCLLHQGLESYHITVVEVGGAGLGLMGNCGAGKSSLAASLIRRGGRLLTDDLLVVRSQGEQLLASPGQPWIKLFPEMGREALGSRADGVPMNSWTSKRIYLLEPHQYCPRAIPLSAIYSLDALDQAEAGPRPCLDRLPPREALLQLLRNTFNATVTTAGRLASQLGQAAAIAEAVPMRALRYRRDVAQLGALSEFVLEDFGRLTRVRVSQGCGGALAWSSGADSNLGAIGP